MNLAILLLPLLAQAQPATPAVPKLAVQLLAAHQTLQPGGQTELAVRITVPESWHLYHPIKLDTGIPTTIGFDVPAGIRVGELRFPTPAYGEQEGIRYLSLAGTFVVLTTLDVAADVPPGPVMIKAAVRGLACKELCLPVDASAALALTVSPAAQAAANEKAFQEARAALPKPLAEAPYLDGGSISISKPKLALNDDAELVVAVRVKKGFHINDRDPGNPTTIPSQLFVEAIDGLKLGDQVWPEPNVKSVPLVGRVREQSGELKLRVPITLIDEKFPSGPVSLHVLFTYQACNERGQCFPPEAAVGVVQLVADTANPPLPAGSSLSAFAPVLGETIAVAARGDTGTVAPTTAESAALASFVVPQFTAADWAEHIPWVAWQPGLGPELARRGHMVFVDYTATWCLSCQSNKKLAIDTAPVRAKMQTLGVIPIKADFTNNDPRMQAELKQWAPTVPVNLIYVAGKPESPAVLPTVLASSDTVVRALEHPEEFMARPQQSLLVALLFGFLGGLILNVMPCVLPVISIKILSFVKQAGEDRGRILRLGLAFSAGILVWFWVFALLAAAGNLPLQYPEVVIALGTLLFVFALSLFGIFEITLPGSAAGGFDALARREGYPGAFLKGLLATLLGTACTAPFLAGALAYAITQPAWIVFLVFTSAGVGMAAPYLLLSAQPGWLRFVPKPGPWMVTFKQAAGFVLLGTAVWLLWILGHQIDGVGVVWTVAFWGFLTLAVWLLGKIRPTWQTGARVTAWAIALLIAAAGFWFCFFYMYPWSQRRPPTTAHVPPATTSFLPTDAASSGWPPVET